ncbi:uncharacterized protein [Acropora muricata]|uniref:uncharacterized protein isoform X1 n=1 Tax=Acropora muricata TaxID=159855 RepID=UPI0034E3F5B3
MAVSNGVVDMVRILAIIHFVVGALLIIFGIVDAVITYIPFLVLPVACGIWTCIAGCLGIPASSLQRTSKRNCYAGVFMGFSIVSTACGGIIIIGYSYMVSFASGPALGIAAVILILGIIQFGTGIWVSICLCLMKPCCTDSQQTGPFPGSTPGYAVAQDVSGGPVAIPMQAPGVTGQTQPFYGYPQTGQTTIGGPVPFQAVGNQPQLVVVPLPGGGFPPQYTEHSQKVPLQEPI